MLLVIELPLIALGAFALGGLDYLRRLLLPDAPQTNPVSSPYALPFTGGQLSGVYYDVIPYYEVNSNVYNPQNPPNWSNRIRRTDFKITVIGSLKGGTVDYEIDKYKWRIIDGNNITYNVLQNGIPQGGLRNYGFEVSRTDGQPDSPNNLPNPNSAPAIKDDGIGSSGEPNLGDDLIVQSGIPFLPILGFLDALNAALNAAKSATDALSAIKSIADAIAKIADLLNKLKDALDEKKKKDDPKNKEITRHDYGSIRYDGYLRIYNSDPDLKKKAVYLDLQLLSIPTYYGKYFGNKSPNFYRFKSLGYISFASPTFGVIQTIEIEFGRMSINIPENASGFFYHLGLDGAIVGNISTFYSEDK